MSAVVSRTKVFGGHIVQSTDDPDSGSCILFEYEDGLNEQYPHIVVVGYVKHPKESKGGCWGDA